jgi:hypothetical protein
MIKNKIFTLEVLELINGDIDRQLGVAGNYFSDKQIEDRKEIQSNLDAFYAYYDISSEQILTVNRIIKDAHKQVCKILNIDWEQ